uniref:LamG domain-containing protein n=1 Tax=viral metagenome TaxID=1070528 RepID=A0A6C0K7U2_9ZZZZ
MSYLNERRSLMYSQEISIIPAILIPTVTFCLLFVIDYIWRSSKDLSLRFVTLLDYTAQSSDGLIVVSQDPSVPEAVQIATSVNENTGIEFAYSFFIIVKESTFSGDNNLRHVFHKGYRTSWPLMCPGVFIKEDTNTMRVVFNTNKNVYRYADVNNIPINKWFHIVLNCYNSGIDIYVNANLAHRIKFDANEFVYQNFQDLLIFSPNISRINGTVTISAGENITFNGSFDGNLSSLKYARYALSIKEINSLMTSGPSTKIIQNINDTNTAYLSDTWWSNQ